MRSCSGYDDWTITSHQLGSYNYDFEWDVDDLTLNGVTLQCEIFPKTDNQGAIKNRPVEGVPFTDLAKGLACYPSIVDGDGHDLTRCVQYCVAHPNKEYIFPRDFPRLVEELGELPVSEGNADRAVFERWATKRDRQTESVEDAEDSMVDDKTDDEGSDNSRVANDKAHLEGFEQLAAHAYLDVSSPFLYPQLPPHPHQQLPEFDSVLEDVAYTQPASYFTAYDQMYAATPYFSEPHVGNERFDPFAGPAFGGGPYSSTAHDAPTNFDFVAQSGEYFGNMDVDPFALSYFADYTSPQELGPSPSVFTSAATPATVPSSTSLSPCVPGMADTPDDSTSGFGERR
jgi:hypothetical protein